ncbi:MAG: hypothetical protein JSU63_00365 [Phycisphaerales bacterium]|nr:MAG: hypothetical protein JSU63_00365 [Phycisphaerales bacterium]
MFCTDEGWIARLSSTIHFQAWNAYGVVDSNLLHISDCQIIPVATYQIRACYPPDGAICSDPITVATIARPLIGPDAAGSFGDVAGQTDPGTGNFTWPDGLANVFDLWALKMSMFGGGAHATWMDVAGGGVGCRTDYMVTAVDLATLRLGLGGTPYTGGDCSNPGSCPDPG